MTAFTPKKLPGEETLGKQLRQARLHKNLRIEDVAKKINIRSEYLISLEEDRFDLLPAGLYGKNFLKEYALFLKIDPQELLSDLSGRTGSGNSDDPFSQKIVAKNKFIIFPKIIRNTLIVSAVLACLLYLVFYCKKIIFPPDLVITQPSKNIMTSDRSMTVSGQTEPEAEVRINDEVILNNHNGYFSQAINMKKGLNNIVVTAKKKYSREITVTRQILVE